VSFASAILHLWLATCKSWRKLVSSSVLTVFTVETTTLPFAAQMLQRFGAQMLQGFR
jgi:hypothetical protein